MQVSSREFHVICGKNSELRGVGLSPTATLLGYSTNRELESKPWTLRRNPLSAILLYPETTTYKTRARTSNRTRTRNEGSKGRNSGPMLRTCEEWLSFVESWIVSPQCRSGSVGTYCRASTFFFKAPIPNIILQSSQDLDFKRALKSSPGRHSLVLGPESPVTWRPTVFRAIAIFWGLIDALLDVVVGPCWILVGSVLWACIWYMVYTWLVLRSRLGVHTTTPGFDLLKSGLVVLRVPEGRVFFWRAYQLRRRKIPVQLPPDAAVSKTPPSRFVHVGWVVAYGLVSVIISSWGHGCVCIHVYTYMCIG